jgi:predicted MFS family arabinose efflux permease
MPAVARVDAGIRTLGQVATLVGALAGGLFANHYGARSALVVSATLFGVAALVAAFNSARLAGDLPRAMPGNRALRRSRVR